MRRTTKYAALDVHQTTTSASVREDGGRVIARAVMATAEGAVPSEGDPDTGKEGVRPEA